MTVMTRPPKAFISHASDDNERFVHEFAKRLLDAGVDIWLDHWELAGGDSLPDRIFRLGIGESDVVLSVLSTSALFKPWVREEFDAAVVRRIEGKTRLVPIVLDRDVEIPVAIAHLLRYSVPQMGIDRVTDEVVRDIFMVSRGLPLANHPPT